MLRTVDIVMIGLLLGGAAFTFKVKQDSEAAIEQVTALKKQIKIERDAIDILQADLSLLTDPTRLQALVERYQDQLGVAPLDPKAIGKVTEIPVKPIEVINPDSGGIAGIIQQDDGITTGGVTRGNDQ